MLNINWPPTSARIKSCVTEAADLHETRKNFLKKNVRLITRTPPLPKSHLYCPCPLPLWSSFSELSEVLSPRWQSSHCPPKNLTCNSHVVHFFGRHMASGPITSWKIDGESVETVADFIFLGSKISADGDYSHEIKEAYSLEGKL